MNTTLAVMVNILIMLSGVSGLIFLKKRNVSFTARVLLAMIVGIIFGAVLQMTYGTTSEVVKLSN